MHIHFHEGKFKHKCDYDGCGKALSSGQETSSVFLPPSVEKTVVRPQQHSGQDIDQTNETFLNYFVTSQHLSVFPSGTYHTLMTPVFRPPFVIASQVIDSSVSIPLCQVVCIGHQLLTMIFSTNNNYVSCSNPQISITEDIQYQN